MIGKTKLIQYGYSIENILGNLDMAKHHCIDKLNKPTLMYIEKATEHLELLNRTLLEELKKLWLMN